MKIVFVSNYFNHHQKPISDAFFRLTGGDYRFIETGKMREERKKLGYGTGQNPEYVLQSYANEEEAQRCRDLILEADVVIAGSAPESFLKARIRCGKLLFRYSERPLKNGFEPLKYPLRFLRWKRQNPFWKPIYMLCAGAYVYEDYSRFLMFRRRSYRWGYFPPTNHHENEDGFWNKKASQELLWVGRLIDWKHPEHAILVAERLKKAGRSFTLNLIGSGDMEHVLRRMITEKELDDCVHLLGSMPPEQVRLHMERAGIFLFTSSRKEGWGAVLNEAMNSGCAVVASRAAGAVPYLVQDGVNGVSYTFGDIDRLSEQVDAFLADPEKQRTVGMRAFETVVALWNADVAAERFLSLVQHIQNGEAYPTVCESGPCSKA